MKSPRGKKTRAAVQVMSVPTTVTASGETCSFSSNLATGSSTAVDTLRAAGLLSTPTPRPWNASTVSRRRVDVHRPIR